MFIIPNFLSSGLPPSNIYAPALKLSSAAILHHHLPPHQRFSEILFSPHHIFHLQSSDPARNHLVRKPETPGRLHQPETDQRTCLAAVTGKSSFLF